MRASLAAPASLSNHRDVLAALAGLPSVSDPNWPFAAAAVGEAVAAAIANPAQLNDSTHRCYAAAQRLACDAISGASPTGETLATATTAIHGLARFVEGTPAACVLLVDGVLATGVSFHLAAQRLLANGASSVRLAALLDLGETGGQVDGASVEEVGR